MSSYENVVGGKLKLKLKGKALDVKTGGIEKKKKHKKQIQHHDQTTQNDLSDAASGGTTEVSLDPNEEDANTAEKSSGERKAPHHDDYLTPAERRYIEP
ncbi:Ergosterol biosynthesis ERG4/ERG24 family isoform 1 [Hibiscus syriacus]|uniref:Ergosterol biosynthesis ERG4/ERG24 family isoform 1 n=1 Tax=Hibiscus syriacus TaxID=106335 RepID=A0A6A2Z8N8_HIBSY|nr:Ergosterol biosynthesis ERG4/ERG24 family isoform 1 [Hibiscus syriacus]